MQEVKEVYEKYKHMDKVLCDTFLLDVKHNIKDKMLYDLWQAIKNAAKFSNIKDTGGPKLRFSKEYSKLSQKCFTTIRINTSFYKLNRTYTIHTPNQTFIAKIISRKLIKKVDITDDLAQQDADCDAKTLREMLEKWYGKKFDDFVILTLRRKEES